MKAFKGIRSWTLSINVIDVAPCYLAQSTDDNYQLVNYTLVSPIDSELAGALAVDYIYGSTRDQVVSMVDSDQRYAGFWVSQDYSTSLLSRSVPAVVEYIHDSGKNYKTVRDLLFSMMLFNEKLRVAIATEFVKQNVTASVGYWLTGPVKISYTDLHPVSTEGQNIFAYMTTLLLWFGCIFIATVTSWMTHPQSPMRATEFGWRLLGAGTMLLLLTAGTSAVPLILNGQFAGIGNSGAGWAAAWGWMMLVGISFLGIISFTYQLAGRDLGQALMVVFGFIQFGTAWALLDQNLSFLVYQVGKGFPMVRQFARHQSLHADTSMLISAVLVNCCSSIHLLRLAFFLSWCGCRRHYQLDSCHVFSLNPNLVHGLEQVRLARWCIIL